VARPKFFQAWAIYREHWLRPFINKAAQQFTICPIHEQINGQIANFRQLMNENQT